jgi:hypothetical protein
LFDIESRHTGVIGSIKYEFTAVEKNRTGHHRPNGSASAQDGDRQIPDTAWADNRSELAPGELVFEQGEASSPPCSGDPAGFSRT